MTRTLGRFTYFYMRPPAHGGNQALDLKIGSMCVSEERKLEILLLTSRGDTETEKQARKFLATCRNPFELHHFAEEYDWDGDLKPVLHLIRNPSVDAATLLFLYWYGCPEYYYSKSRFPFRFGIGEERLVYKILLDIEKRYLSGQYGSASISFDPAYQINEMDRHDLFPRKIPREMTKPV